MSNCPLLYIMPVLFYNSLVLSMEDPSKDSPLIFLCHYTLYIHNKDISVLYTSITYIQLSLFFWWTDDSHWCPLIFIPCIMYVVLKSISLFKSWKIEHQERSCLQYGLLLLITHGINMSNFTLGDAMSLKSRNAISYFLSSCQFICQLQSFLLK